MRLGGELKGEGSDALELSEEGVREPLSPSSGGFALRLGAGGDGLDAADEEKTVSVLEETSRPQI